MIEDIKARAKAATPGPFELPAYGNGLVAIVSRAGGLTRNVVADKVLSADAEFFTHAHKDIDGLLTELKEAREKLEAVGKYGEALAKGHVSSVWPSLVAAELARILHKEGDVV